jgi:toxin YoeB
MRDVIFNGSSFADFTEWSSANKAIFKRIVELIREIRRTPYEGKGNPEPLKHELAGKWSRKIDMEHRLVYEITENTVEIISCKYHYN